MKLLIASDIHGAAGHCRQLLDAWDREGADRLLLLGDVLYHGPRNDLPPDYAPKEVIALLNARKDKIFCVRGNCDTEVDQMVLEFPIWPITRVHGGPAAGLRHPRPRVQHRAPAAAASGGYSAARSYPRARMAGVRQ